jgi:hypothetical protein
MANTNEEGELTMYTPQYIGRTFQYNQALMLAAQVTASPPDEANSEGLSRKSRRRPE